MTQVLSMTITMMIAVLVATVLFNDSRAAVPTGYQTPAAEQTGL